MTSSQLMYFSDGEKKLLAKPIIAKNALERARGLLFRDMLACGEAMVILKCSAVHTCFMKYAIDVVYVNRSGVVEKIVHNLKPWRFSAALNAAAVIELLAGEAHRNCLRRGIKIEGL